MGRRTLASVTLLFAVCFILGLDPSAFAQEVNQFAPSPPSNLPPLQAVKSCMNSAASAECLDQLFREALSKHSTIDLLQLVQRFGAEDPELRSDCHPIVHAIGRETFRIKGNIHESFAACDQTCHSGCYHGSVERFLRGESIYAQIDKHPSAAELRQKASAACDPNMPLRLHFQCLHGLGHALLFFSRYQLLQSLEACDVLSEDWSRNSCYGGVFMENVFNAMPEARDLSPTDYHYPCSKLNPRYRSECYGMQTSRMTEMGLSTEQLFQECNKASEYRHQCSASVGRDLSNIVRAGQVQPTAEKCEMVTGESRFACMRGVVHALIDNTWDGRYALAFCAALTEENDRNTCFQMSADYLKRIFEKSSADIAQDCSEHLRQPERCVELSR